MQLRQKTKNLRIIWLKPTIIVIQRFNKFSYKSHQIIYCEKKFIAVKKNSCIKAPKNKLILSYIKNEKQVMAIKLSVIRA